jgi:peptidyl-tRNA hydrolase
LVSSGEDSTKAQSSHTRRTLKLFGCGNYYWPNSRESVGIRFVEHAQTRLNSKWLRMNSAKVDIAMSSNLAFVKPLTYMTDHNWRSLNAVSQMLEIPSLRVILVYPELRLDAGHYSLNSAGSQSIAERARFLRQFFNASPNASFSYLGFGVGGPKLRTEVALSASYGNTTDARLERAFLSNRLPREFDDALLGAFDKALDQIRFDSTDGSDSIAAASIAATAAAVKRAPSASVE